MSLGGSEPESKGKNHKGIQWRGAEGISPALSPTSRLPQIFSLLRDPITSICRQCQQMDRIYILLYSVAPRKLQSLVLRQRVPPPIPGGSCLAQGRDPRSLVSSEKTGPPSLKPQPVSLGLHLCHLPIQLGLPCPVPQLRLHLRHWNCSVLSYLPAETVRAKQLAEQQHGGFYVQPRPPPHSGVCN